MALRFLAFALLAPVVACSSNDPADEDSSTGDVLDVPDESVSDTIPEPDCEAGPGVTGVTGAFAPGSTVVITGCSFGEKDPAPPLLWDTVENQSAYGTHDVGDTVPTGDGMPWMDNGEHSWVNNVKFYTGDETRWEGGWTYWIPSTEDPKGKGFLRGHDFDLPGEADLYVSWWQKVDNCTPAEHASTGILVVQTRDLPTDGFMDWMFTEWSLSDTYVEGDDMFSSEHSAWWYGTEPCDSTWSHYEALLVGTGSTDHGIQGRATMWRDRVVRCAAAISGDPEFCQDRPWQARSAFDQIRVLGLDIDEPDRASVEPTNTWLSEIYVDSTQARVLVGDTSRFYSVTHFELQPPVSWTADTIEAEVHRGSFEPGQRAWIYVVDPDGNHNVEGYPIDW